MKYFLFLCFLGLAVQSDAQHDRRYFRNPLGIPMQLVANFGEVRSDHYHMGFDLRTNQRENLPVYAAAEGYISRIVIEPAGYGRAIFITHPSGYTTLYAHLNDFYPALQAFVEHKQFNEEKWEQDITFNNGQFPVRKGQFIAYSGNSGASQGPHLHFEIRDSRTGNNINPRLFDFPIADRIPPFIYKLYLYDRQYSTYAIDPEEIRIRGSKGRYTTRDSVIETGSQTVSFGISAEDMGNTSPFRFGIHAAALWVDGDSSPVFSFALDGMNYDDSRYVNAAIDYRKRMTDGTLIQHLSKLPGNQLSIFQTSSDDRGVIVLNDTLVHDILIFVKDISGNETVLKTRLRWNPSLYEQRFFTQDREIMVPGKSNRFERENITIDFPPSALYDTLPFFYSEASSPHIRFPLHQLHYHYVPLHDAYTVSIKYDEHVNYAKAVWKLASGKSISTSKAELLHGRLTGSFNRFGTLTLIEDTTTPIISPVGWKDGAVFARNGSISFTAKDQLSYVDHFRAELDGEWLMFAKKGSTYTYRFDERCPIGKHSIKIAVRDIAGNETVETYTFELKEKLPVKKKTRKTTKKKRR